MVETNRDEQDREIIAKEQEMVKECEKFVKSFAKKFGTKAVIVSAIGKEWHDPIVYFDGEQLDYTELAVMVATNLRNIVLQRLGMNR